MLECEVHSSCNGRTASGRENCRRDRIDALFEGCSLLTLSSWSCGGEANQKSGDNGELHCCSDVEELKMDSVGWWVVGFEDAEMLLMKDALLAGSFHSFISFLPF